MAQKQAVGDADSHHKVGNCEAFSALAACNSGTVALGVNTPEAQVGVPPLRGDAVEPEPGEFADLIEALPRILFALQPLRALRLGFLHLLRHRASIRTKYPQTKKPTSLK